MFGLRSGRRNLTVRGDLRSHDTFTSGSQTTKDEKSAGVGNSSNGISPLLGRHSHFVLTRVVFLFEESHDLRKHHPSGCQDMSDGCKKMARRHKTFFDGFA